MSTRKAAGAGLPECDTGLQDLMDELRVHRQTIQCAVECAERTADMTIEADGPQEVIRHALEGLMALERKLDDWVFMHLRKQEAQS